VKAKHELNISRQSVSKTGRPVRWISGKYLGVKQSRAQFHFTDVITVKTASKGVNIAQMSVISTGTCNFPRIKLSYGVACSSHLGC
jgi:hypothetical protein